MIVVDHAGTRWTGTQLDWDRAARQLRDTTLLHLPGFLDAALLDRARALLEQTRFEQQQHGRIGRDERAEPGPLAALMLLVLNDPELLRLVEALTGRGPLDGFDGRVYRIVPGTEHVDSWHSDAGRNRRVAISINLNRGVVPTAPLQIRRRDAENVLHEFANSTPGDAVLFTLDDVHVHRVKPMPGVATRVACAGWFHSGGDMRAWLRQEPGADARS